MDIGSVLERDLPTLASLLESFSALTGVASAVIDLEGVVLVGARWQRACTDFHRACPGSAALCLESGTVLAGEMTAGAKTAVYRCRNGLTDAAAPVVVDGQHVANAFVGQFLLEPPDLDFFREQARARGYDEEAYLEAIREVPVVREVDVPGMLSFLTTAAQVTTDLALGRVREHAALNAALDTARSEVAVRERLATLFATVHDDDVYGELLNLVLAATGSKYGVVGYIDDDGAVVAPSMTRSVWTECEVPDKTIVFPRETWGHARWARALRERRSYWGNEPSFVPEGHVPIHRSLAVPVVFRGASIGLLHVANREGSYGPEEVSLLEGIAAQAAPLLAARLAREREERARVRAEEELQETRDYLENLLTYANAPIIVWDPDLRITRFNTAFERLTGMPAAEALGSPIDVLFPEASREDSMRLIGETTSGERWESVEVPILHRSGDVRTVLWSSAGVRDPATGVVIAVIAQGQDITERRRAQDELRETRDYLDSLLTYANAPIIVWDLDLRITRFNAAFERLTGMSAAEALGSPVDVLFPAEGREDSMRLVRGTTSGDRWESVEVPFLHRSGDVRIVLWNSAGVRDPTTGAVIAVIAQGQDITDRQKAQTELRETRDYLESLLAYANAPIIVWDLDLRITRSNAAFERLTGMPSSEALGSPVDVLFPEASREDSMRLIRGTTLGDRWESIEVPILHRSGDVRTVLWNSAGVRDPTTGAVIAVIAQGQDITARLEAERALAVQAADLARSNLDLEQFAYVASHDLQEPLRAISGFARLLERRYAGRLDDDADAYIGFITDGAERLSQMIRDLLAFSRVSTRGEAFAPVDTEALLIAVLADLSGALSEADATVTHDPLPRVIGDAGQLRQVFQNLVANAAKFRGEQPPQIHVSAESLGTEWRFTVSDNGIGFDTTHAERIFVIFQRLESREQYPGTGIGLAICKRVIERHGGQIGVDSKPGEGARFWFTLAKREGG